MTAIKKLLTSVVTEALLKDLILYGLRRLEPKTTNQVNKDLIAIVEKALQTPQNPS